MNIFTPRFLTLVIFSLGLITSLSCHSLPPMWDTAQLKYVNYSVKNDNPVPDPKGLEFSFTNRLFSRLLLVGSVDYLESEEMPVQFDQLNASIGLGYLHALYDTSDSYLILSYKYAEFTSKSISEELSSDAEGYGVKIGYIARWFNQFEFDFHLEHLEIDDNDLARGFDINYYFMPNCQFSVDYTEFDDQRRFGIGVTYVF